MDNSSNWCWWIWKTPMMCFVPHSTPIGDHVRKMVRIIPLMYSMTYWSRINKNFLMNGSLVIRIKLTCSRARESITIRRGDVPTFLAANRNVHIRKLDWSVRSHWTLKRIRTRRLVATMERWDMLRKPIRRKLMTWKRRWSSLNGMWKLCNQLVGRLTHLPSMSELLKHCMLTHRRINGLLTLVALISRYNYIKEDLCGCWFFPRYYRTWWHSLSTWLDHWRVSCA